MNKKTREVIQDLLDTLDDHCLNDESPLYKDDLAKKRAAIAAAEKLLNPPVRFAWARSEFDGAYVVEIAGVRYTIRQASGRTLTWHRVVTIEGKDVESAYHFTLAAAKQACVDYGVARAQAKRAFVNQGLALFDNARHFNGTLRPSAGPMGGPGAGPARGSQP